LVGQGRRRCFTNDQRLTTRDGFTLVELLVVIAIITMLAGLVVGAAQSARRRAAVTKAKAAIAGLETAIEMYESDIGAWPSSGNETLVTALEGPNDAAGWEGPYMRFKESDLEEGALLDPWGRSYQYQVPGDAGHGHEQYFDLSSAGPDGEFDNVDDVTNW
jgi:general secretion pathway protein G